MLAIWQQDKRVLGTFSLRMRRNGYLGASGQKSDLAIRFNDPDFLWQHNISSVGIHFHHVLEISLVHMRRNSVNSASGLKLPSPSCSATTISYEGDKIVAIWQQYKWVLCIFSLRMCRNSNLGASGKKNLTLPFAPATFISYNRGITLLSQWFGDLFSAHAQK